MRRKALAGSRGAFLGALLTITLCGAAHSAATPDVEEARVPTAREAMPTLFATDVAELGDLRAFALENPAACSDRSERLIGSLFYLDAAKQQQGRAATHALDDRPLYWTRLASLASHRLRCPDHERERQAFERASRGLDRLHYSDDSALRVLVTGFDPFFLDRDVTQSNPSGVAALHMATRNAVVGGQRVEIRSAIVPVRFRDFDEGLVEEQLVPLAIEHDVDLLITISMGRDEFDLERFPGRRRSAEAPDNRNVLTGASASDPRVPPLRDDALVGPEFVEFTLPAAAMTRGEGRWPVNDNRTVTTLEAGTLEAASLAELEGQTAVRGGGGGYLSNEISYRVLNALRNQGAAHIRSGHIHTPRLRGHDGPTVTAIAAQTEALVLRAADALLRERR